MAPACASPGWHRADGRWLPSRPAFLLPVRVLGALFRRLFVTRLLALHGAGKLGFFGKMAELADRRTLSVTLQRSASAGWSARPPFAGPEAVLAYFSRYTHRVAISNRRLLRFGRSELTSRYKDYPAAAPTGSGSWTPTSSSAAS
ncbi:transposase [Devosia sp. YIM 151766]|uniref:transposase n=1 Tax=Devosia sp. YIM 151766 TaxID=3017325 RepID=UPI00255CD1FC|nr:transposase [Devosia sp. YIM 151766]WIY53909.1 transposase [Devosia sp. YIM 151766]